ncbi:MAG: DUF188 domain-containing protein, partial [Clostridia bacterium]|nr:DUF188 domain-containing protein [Clostridia bacterium]
HDIEVIMVCDTAHVISDDYSKVITVDKGSDSADFKIINISKPGDIIVTGDYGVAAMALSKGARTLGNSGVIYTNFNIDSFLAQRHLAKENRRKGGRFTNIKKRTSEENINFTGSLIKLIHSK